MCGHVGAVTKALNGFTSKEVDAVLALLYFDNFRGEDATSMTVIENDGRATLYKEATSAPDFIRAPGIKKGVSDAISHGQAIICHNRKATVGGYKDEHAHPFVIDNRYIFNHNGKLQNHVKYAQTEVDSEALGQIICPLGEDVKALGDKLSEIDAAYACVWYDAELHKIKVIRNSERPLWYAKNSMTTFYASEAWMLEAVNKLYSLSLDVPAAFVVNRLYEWDLKNNDPTSLTYEEVTITKKAPPPYTGGSPAKSTKTSTTNSKGTSSGAKNHYPELMEGCSTWNNPFLQALEHDIEWPVLSRAQFKRQKNKLANSMVTAWVDDVVAEDWLKESGQDLKTYVAYCSTDDYPSWVFTFKVKAKNYQEAEAMLEGKFICGFVGNFTHENDWGMAGFLDKSKISTPSKSIKKPSQVVTH